MVSESLRPAAALRALAGCVLALLLLAGTGAAAAPQELDRIVAIVDDDVVLASELVDRMTLIEQQIQAGGILPVHHFKFLDGHAQGGDIRFCLGNLGLLRPGSP